jgi:hypothetical protein
MLAYQAFGPLYTNQTAQQSTDNTFASHQVEGIGYEL